MLTQFIEVLVKISLALYKGGVPREAG